MENNRTCDNNEENIGAKKEQTSETMLMKVQRVEMQSRVEPVVAGDHYDDDDEDENNDDDNKNCTVQKNNDAVMQLILKAFQIMKLIFFFTVHCSILFAGCSFAQTRLKRPDNRAELVCNESATKYVLQSCARLEYFIKTSLMKVVVLAYLNG